MKVGDFVYVRARFPGQDTLGRVAKIVSQPNDGFWIVRILGENFELECAPEYLLRLVGEGAQQNEEDARVDEQQNSAEG